MRLLTKYIEKALSTAKVEKMEDGRYFGYLGGFQDPWADGDTKENCLEELREVFEEWLVLALREDDELPELDGLTLNFGGGRWQDVETKAGIEDTVKPQFIVDQKGKKKAVVLSIKEYEELLEDLEDLSILAKRRGEPTVPWEDVKESLEAKWRSIE